MATWQEHQAKAEGNEAFGLALHRDQQILLEWAATSLFYSGLHYVEALLEKKHTATAHHNHTLRNKAIANDARLRPIWREYQDLYNLSRDARYYCNRITRPTVENDVIPAHATVKAHITELL